MITLEYPPRVRVEWFLAAARIGLAAGALVAISADGPGLGFWQVHNLLISYLIYSVGILALVWTPVSFGRSWGIGLHLFDLAAFAALTVLTGGAASPFFLTLIYLFVAATIRWQARGTFWTAAGAAAAFAIASLYLSTFSDAPLVTVQTFVIRVVYLMVIAALLAYLGAHHHRYHTEIGRLATWPRTMSREPYAVECGLD